jgi:MEMO1 family protein
MADAPSKEVLPMQREPVVAGMFYPANPQRCAEAVAQYIQQARPQTPKDGFFAGVVPHAGWSYSGAVAARAFAALAESGAPETVVLFGAVHNWGVDRPALYGPGTWDTPLGPVSVDDDLNRAILQAAEDRIVQDPDAHEGEHSIEVQVPFVRYLFPQARIVPLLVPPAVGAEATGEIVARATAARKGRIYFVGSSDLTHYGARNYGFAPHGSGVQALAWARQNDCRLLDDMVAMRASDIVPRATADRSACGPGAIAATVAAAAAWGAKKGVILEQTSSYDVQPAGAPSDFVGYAAVVF